MRWPTELDGRWNHNTHYYPLALARAPRDGRVLDVGCGDGLLLRLLAQRCREVTGVDPWTDPSVVADVPNATVLRSDFLAAPLEPASFDLVCSFTAIHHLPFEAALARMAGLLRPGGRLVVSSIVRYTPWGYALGGVTIPFHRWSVRTRGWYEHPAPVAQTAMTLRDVRAVARRVVPGARVRRRLYWRYTLTWTAPADAGSAP